MTIEPQYEHLLETATEKGISRLGLMTNDTWNLDPTRLLFVLSRYKFVAKMLYGRRWVAEIGCGDGFASTLVRETVGRLVLYDIDPIFIADAKARDPSWAAFVHDILMYPLPDRYDGVYALDVFEHISEPRIFLSNICASLEPHGALILGVPSVESQTYASEQSRLGHVNCTTEAAFRVTLEEFFHNVFIFSMNDEVVHTGFSKMAHYRFALCTEVK